MNVLVVGGGGREHALAWGLRRSPHVENVFCAPGNGGTGAVARNVPVDWENPVEFSVFLDAEKIGLTVIGPEAPLVEGLADRLRREGRPVFGPSAGAARLEGSKAFAKTFMKAHGIPTADFKIFTRAEEAVAFVKGGSWPESLRVVKASGLAAGKGVVVASSREEVLSALEDMMVRRVFGAAGDVVVLEEALSGEELSVIALCDGKTLRPLVSAQDHKRIFDGDRGPNTGGMGAYGPVPRATPALMQEIEEKVFAPFLKGLAAENLDYRGAIYFGLMLTPAGPRVLEFNVRFGDPETQVIVPMVENDWLDLLLATAQGRLDDVSVVICPGAGLCVVLAAEGYPGEIKKGASIRGLEQAAQVPGVTVFHAGTALRENETVVSGGRVLAVTALGPDLPSARDTAYQAVGMIHFDGAHYRNDIAVKGLPKPAK
jgi:phosphoribosylamine--glycine ligase